MCQRFEFLARDYRGKKIQGDMEGNSQLEVIKKLSRNGYTVTNIREKVEPKPLFQRKVPYKELAIVCRQLSTMVRTGVPIIQGINTVEQQIQNKKLKEILQQVARDIADGDTLAISFQKHKNFLPSLMINTLESAEASGRLDYTLDLLSDSFQKEHRVRGKIKSALTYPLTILVFANIMIFALIVYALPTFIDMFSKAGAELPLITKILIFIHEMILNYGIFLIAALFLVGLLMFQWLQTKQGKQILDYLLWKLPVIGDIFEKIITYRFSQTLRDLNESGISIDQSLAITAKVVNHSQFSEGIEKARQEVRRGKGIAESLEKNVMFPAMVTSMIRVGEKSGDLDTLLIDVSKYSQRELAQKIDQITTLIEPVFIIVIGLSVGFVVMGILLPMYDGMMLMNK